MREKKGQAWGYDLIVAVVIFVIGIFIFFLYTLNYDSSPDSLVEKMQYESLLVGDSLLSEGHPSEYPVGWTVSDISDIERIGILSEGKVDETKLKYFYQMAQDNDANYKKTKLKFNIENNYWVNFSQKIDITGDGVGDISGVGFQMTGSAKNVVKDTRVVAYGNKITNMDVYIWN